jgi:hypothetical protein
MVHTTLWTGRPTLVGGYDAGCAAEDVDYLVMRLSLAPSSVDPSNRPFFTGGFE